MRKGPCIWYCHQRTAIVRDHPIHMIEQHQANADHQTKSTGTISMSVGSYHLHPLYLFIMTFIFITLWTAVSWVTYRHCSLTACSLSSMLYITVYIMIKIQLPQWASIVEPHTLKCDRVKGWGWLSQGKNMAFEVLTTLKRCQKSRLWPQIFSLITKQSSWSVRVQSLRTKTTWNLENSAYEIFYQKSKKIRK